MIILDDAITDEALLTELQEPNSTFWEIGFSWWGGWMNGHEPTTLRHRLIEHLWKNRFYSKITHNIAGFEHWCGVYDHQDYRYKVREKYAPGYCKFALNHHIDSDEYLHKEGITVTPKIGTIVYPKKTIEDCKGGYLRIYDSNTRYEQYLRAGEMISEPYELIKPKFNRMIIFDASKLHAVEEVKSGVRHAVAINLWGDRLSDGQLETCKEVIG